MTSISFEEIVVVIAWAAVGLVSTSSAGSPKGSPNAPPSPKTTSPHQVPRRDARRDERGDQADPRPTGEATR
jgi:hypothetical protein